MCVRFPCEHARVRIEVRNQIQMLGNNVAAEMPPRRESHRRWLRLGRAEGGILLLEVEVPVGVDPTEWAKTDADYVVVSQEEFSSLDLALAALEERGVNTSSFDAVWKTDNPF